MNKFLFLMCLLSCVFLTACAPWRGPPTGEQTNEQPNEQPNEPESQVDLHATMPNEFLESRVDELKDLESGWIRTSAIYVDMDGKIWIDPSAVPKSPHNSLLSRSPGCMSLNFFSVLR